MIICPKCKSENDDSTLRCHSCDEWLLFYEFKDIKKTDGKRSKVKESASQVFLPDSLVTDEPEKPVNFEIERVLRLGEDAEKSSEAILSDAAVQIAFSPICPNCSGEIKTYEVKCRHCNAVLRDKIEQSRKLKPVWEKMFRDKVLQDGKYNDIYGKGEVKLIFKTLFDKGNKLIWYMVFIILFMIFGGVLLLYCAKTML